ncbi:MAG: radical SAM protein [Clostridia bacterium]|nr:radical SAM protein [Clostridia bacterium]MBQ8858157.1 radical SAM protein [Clostridia bacterium]
MLTADISEIGRHRFARDGTGVRTLVCFAGCPLRCRYCLNPYTWDGTKEPKTYSVSELIDAVSVDSVYFQATGGGVTFGGGEPLLHANFIREFMESAPRTWSYAIETSLAVPFANAAVVAKGSSLFIVDVKTFDPHAYDAYTGGDVRLIKENIEQLVTLVGAERILARVPAIPDYTDTASQARTVDELRDMGITAVDIFDYVVP